jgi:hypothetical protein
MTNEQKQITIAEACGWEILDAPLLYGDFACYAKDSSGQEFPGIPDYLTDLNAMHEAEDRLTDGQCQRYISALIDVVQAESTEDYREVFAIAHATAAQRADAFIKTLNLWNEDEEAEIDPRGYEERSMM